MKVKDCEMCLEMPLRLEVDDSGRLRYWCSNCGSQDEIPNNILGITFIEDVYIPAVFYTMRLIKEDAEIAKKVQDMLARDMFPNWFEDFCKFSDYLERFSNAPTQVEDLPEKINLPTYDTCRMNKIIEMVEATQKKMLELENRNLTVRLLDNVTERISKMDFFYPEEYAAAIDDLQTEIKEAREELSRPKE